MADSTAGISVFQNMVEVASATVRTYDGDSLEVQGGAWLAPEEVLRTTNEIERLRARAAEQDALTKVLPVLICTAGLAGLALGFWLGRRRDDD